MRRGVSRTVVIPLVVVVVVVVGAAAVFLSAGPSPTSSTTSSSSSTTSCSSCPQYGGTLTIEVLTDKGTPADPDVVQLGPQTGTVQNEVYEGLTAVNEQGAVVPALATSWVEKSPTDYVFTLRQNVLFQDGTRFNASSVVFTFNRMLSNKQTVRYNDVAEIANVTALNNYQVEFKLLYPYSDFLPSLSIAKGIVSPAAVAKYGSQFGITGGVGTGPYNFVDYVQNDHITLKANPLYWGPKPYIQTIIIKVVPDPTVRALDLQAGQAQIVELNPQGAQIVSGRDGIQVIKGSERQFNTISINLDPRYSIAPLMDVRVRQAINYAINRSALVQYVLLGYGDPAIGPTPSSIANAWNESLKVYPFNSDDAKAKQLLTEAGYPNGFNVKILTAEFNPNFLQVTEVVAADLKKVGINATIDQESFSTAATLLLSGNQTWSMAFHDWGGNLPTAYAVMGQFFNPADIGYFNWNLQHVNDSVLQTDLNQLQAADASQVLAISSRIEARIINQAYGALLYYPQVLAGATSNVHGFGIPPSPWWGYAIFMPEIGAEVWLSSGTSSSSMASFPPTAFPVVPLVSSVLILLYLVSPLKDSIFRFGKRRNDV